jgi:hypothetical protein
MMRMLKRAAVVVVMGVAMLMPAMLPAAAKTPPAKQGEAVRALQAPGSRVIMDLPKSFMPTPRFVGFMDEARQISFVIADFPAEAMAKMAEGFSPSALQGRGFLDPREATLTRQDTYIFRRFAQTSPTGLVQKFVLVFSDGTATAMVSANVPTPLLSSGAVTERAIELMLASARLAPNQMRLPLVATLSDTASLKLALTAGQTQMWTVDGTSGEARVASPAIILAASMTYDRVSNPAQLAASALGGLAGHRNIAFVGNAVAVKIGQHAGFELTATADADTNGEPRALYQFLIPQAEGGYLRFIGIAPRADKDLWFVAFRNSVKSLKVKD